MPPKMTPALVSSPVTGVGSGVYPAAGIGLAFAGLGRAILCSAKWMVQAA
jgi:hypothetical protein